MPSEVSCCLALYGLNKRIHLNLGQCIIERYSQFVRMCLCSETAQRYINWTDGRNGWHGMWCECIAYITLICAHLIQLTAFQVVFLFISGE